MARIKSSLINREFLIRYIWDGLDKSYLVSASQYSKLVGNPKMAQRHFKEALKSKTDKHTIKLRRGLKIDFVAR